MIINTNAAAVTTLLVLLAATPKPIRSSPIDGFEDSYTLNLNGNGNRNHDDFSQIPVSPSDHSQGYQFDPLLHLPGTSPYFDAVGFGLQHRAPEGCNVTAASYLIRHGAIYANDDEYEEYIKPFLFKLENLRGSFSGPLAFLNGWHSPILEDKLEELTPSGATDAKKVGEHLYKRYPHLIPTAQRILADKKSRTYDTARALVKSFPQADTIDVVRIKKHALNGSADVLIPHKVCPNFSKSPGKEEFGDFLKVYGRPVAKRLSQFYSAGDGSGLDGNFTLSEKDVMGMQSICGYESAIKGKRSPLCGVFADADWMAYEYAWDLRYAHMVGPLNNLSPYLGFPWLRGQAELFDDINEDVKTKTQAPSTRTHKNNNSEVENENEDEDERSKKEGGDFAAFSQAGWPKSQRFFLSFTHREVPPFVATALGIFNSSSRAVEEFPTTHINWVRAWRMSDLIPFLGHVGMEMMVCDRPDQVPGASHDGNTKTTGNENVFVRVIANTAPRPMPLCQSGPGASCPFDEFQGIISSGVEKYGDFDGVCGRDEEK